MHNVVWGCTEILPKQRQYGKISAQPHNIVKQICFPNCNLLFCHCLLYPRTECIIQYRTEREFYRQYKYVHKRNHRSSVLTNTTLLLGALKVPVYSKKKEKRTFKASLRNSRNFKRFLRVHLPTILAKVNNGIESRTSSGPGSGIGTSS